MTGKTKFPTGSSSTKTFYVFSGDTLIGEVSSGTPTYAYSWGASGLVSQRDIGNNLSLWYHSGPQKETRQMTNSSGTVADSYRYDGYGRTLASSGTDFNPLRYGGGVGYYSEGAAGFMLATHRWYSPQVSRWMSRDPIEYDGGENFYSYVMTNPMSHVDPSGLDAVYVKYIAYEVAISDYIKIPLGHGGVIAVDPQSGKTQYYEFGRYGGQCGDVRGPTDLGKVDFDKQGNPTKGSLEIVISEASRRFGQGKVVYYEYTKKNYQNVIDYAELRKAQAISCERRYRFLSDNCMVFGSEAAAE